VGLSTSGVTRLVDRLERGGLATRETAPGDRRSTYAVLTAAGADKIDQALPAYSDAVRHWLIDQLTPEQLDGLLAALRILRDRLRPDSATITPPMAEDRTGTAVG
jgi:DNA-binding MarR family transcriptional regulator